MAVLLQSLVNLATIFSFLEAINAFQAVLLILGLLLLVLELFIPGFGIAGISGFVLLIIGIILTARTAFEATVMILLLLVLGALLVVLVLRSAKKGHLARKLILRSAARKEEGYSTTQDRKNWVGRQGVTLTVLRPSGMADFDGERLDVVTEGTYLPAKERIEIVRVEGRRIIVHRLEEPSEP